MAGSFSLVEKLAVAGAFCALVAMAVGTESDPGLIAASPEETVRPAGDAVTGTPAPRSANFWSKSSGAQSAPGIATAPPPPEPEILPPGFGSTPSPDLPQ